MKYGVFLGSFDPPHIGHVNLVTEVLNSDKIHLDKVFIIPSFHNPWKKIQRNYEDRVNMTAMTFQSLSPRVEVSKIEQEIAVEENLDVVHSYKTLRELSERIKEDGSEIYIITSPETFIELTRWEKGGEILRDYKIIVVYLRHFNKTLYCLTSESITTIYPKIDLDLCSSDIRKRLEENKLIDGLVNPRVLDYIKETKIYQND